MDMVKNKNAAIKLLIKQAVKEAIREVFEKEIIPQLTHKEEPEYKKETVFADTFKSPSSLQEDMTRPSAISDIFKEVKSSMSSNEARQFLGETKSVHFTTDSVKPSSYSPQIGVNIENLDFVKKAASVYNLAEKKSKK